MLRILDGFVFSLANVGKATAKVDPNFLEPLSAPDRPRSLQFYRVSCLHSCRAGAEKRETNETWQILYKPKEPRKICKPLLLAMILCCEIVVLLLVLLEPQLEADSPSQGSTSGWSDQVVKLSKRAHSLSFSTAIRACGVVAKAMWRSEHVVYFGSLRNHKSFFVGGIVIYSNISILLVVVGGDGRLCGGIYSCNLAACKEQGPTPSYHNAVATIIA